MTQRRDFIRQAGLGLAAGTAGIGMPRLDAPHAAGQAEQGPDLPLTHQGPKEVVRGKKAVASSQSPIVTQVMLDAMKAGGNAVDAVIAGCITQATVQPEMTNHTGTVSFCFHEAKTGRLHYLNSMGVLPPNLPLFRTYPPGLGGVAAGPPVACIPGFMPGMKAMHEKFGSRPWAALVQPAISYAEDGFPIDEFQRSLLEEELEGNTYFPSMRAIFAPDGFTPPVGARFRNPALGKTLRALASEGPDHMLTGLWAREFVKVANELGWAITMDDMTNNPPRWTEPYRFAHRGHEIVQAAPPERQGLYCHIVLGMLRHLGIDTLGHPSENAEALYYMAHALARADHELGQLHDPDHFGVPLDVWGDDGFHAQLAKIVRTARPGPTVDLTTHVMLTTGKMQLAAFGWATAGPAPAKPPSGSCELACVDPQGNWVQMMNTLQSGGIPGIAVNGVHMIGSHAVHSMLSPISYWLGIPRFRMRSVMGHTIVLKDGKPVLSLGTPGNVHCTMPQMLSAILDNGKDPYVAATLPRMSPITHDYNVEIENRIPDTVLRGITRLGVKVKPRPPYDYHMGSFQQAWRDPATGLLNAATDPRRAGKAGGF